ncbi:unnamed protein product [Blumeria hordei]|uniref:Transmembrane protein 135 N-terminal domain-containing protein n=1 Tax=Blumeria hordei TaxID=2867405 RepID=A0A383UKI9_BLUHO|nr:unnamed protein product [Blumeria hordei]
MVNEAHKNKLNTSHSTTVHAILRNFLRYTISVKEYDAIHKHILARSRLIRRRAISVNKFERIVGGVKVEDFRSADTGHGSREGGSSYNDRLTSGDEYNTAAIRESIRVFIGTALALKVWKYMRLRVLGHGRSSLEKINFWKSSYFRLSLSFSTILLLHRILYRFFTRLRSHLLASYAAPFRRRNKGTTAILTSRYSPAIGASLSGLALGIYPAKQLRIVIAIYTLSRAAEFTYNLSMQEAWIWKEGRPPWWGSWLLFPIASGQLLHAFVYDRDQFPKEYGEFILKYSPQYIQQRPQTYPASLPWPSRYTIVDNLASMAKLGYPAYTSPIVFPTNKPLFPEVAPITNSAHPMINRMPCATLHPADPSCMETYFKYWMNVFPQLARFFTIIFSFSSLLGLIIKPKDSKTLLNAPVSVLSRLIERILRYSVFASGSIGTSWASICLFQYLLPNNVVPESRFFLGGLLGGLWAWVVRREARNEFLHSMRASFLSYWQVGKKRGWWYGIRGGDILIFVGSLALLNSIYERDGGRGTVDSTIARMMLRGVRGHGWRGDVSKEKKDETSEV